MSVFTMKFYLSFPLICLACQTFSASDIQNAKQRLSIIQTQVSSLKKTLDQTEKDRNELNHSLQKIETTIHEHIQTLHHTTQNIFEKEQNIQSISQRLLTLEDTEKKQEEQLAHHLQLRYKLSFSHPINRIRPNQSSSQIAQFFEYYKYIVTQDTLLIKTLQTTTQHILLEKNRLSIELDALKILKQDQEKTHEALKTKKYQQNSLLSKLSGQIQTKKQLLVHYEKNQAELEKVLTQLPHPTIQTESPALSAQMQHRFSSPLGHQTLHAKHMNQGMLFIAQEGTSVSAILSGKVVFSDWLNGYGLLLIIDHGNGVMSLYAHNESLFRKKGEQVKSGEQIATVGHTGGVRENGLYFELRRNGKVVPPRQWLA